MDTNLLTSKKVSAYLIGATFFGLLVGVAIGKSIIKPRKAPNTYNECVLETLASAKTDAAVYEMRSVCEDRFPLGGDLVDLPEGFTPDLPEGFILVPPASKN